MVQLTKTTKSYINVINNMLEVKLTFKYKTLDNTRNVIFKRNNKILKTFSVNDFEGIVNFLDGFYCATTTN